MSAGKVFLFLGLFVLLSGFTGRSAAKKVEEGNRLFKEGKYEEALNRYSEAQGERPDSPEILFNMGDSFYRQKKYNEAIEAHTRSMGRPQESTAPLQAMAHYNIGNSLFRQNNLEGALEAYKRAIDLNPGDIDTKYNIEFIQRQLKEKQKQEKKKQRSQDKSQQEAREKQEQGGGQQGEEEEESEGGAKQEKEKPEESEPSPQGISKADAERLLGAFQSEEKALPAPLKEGEEKFVEAPPEKDW